MTEAQQPSEQQSGSSSPIVQMVAGLGILMVAAGIIVGTVQALRPGPELPADGAPALILLAPQTGDTIDGAIPLHFTAGDSLQLGGMGWASGELHVHAYVDGREFMPAAADIEALPDGTFRWTLAAASGNRIVQLRWAGMNHGPIDAGQSAPVEVLVR